KALLGVLADPDVADADIDAFVAGYAAPAAAAAEEEAAPEYNFLQLPPGQIRYAARGIAGDGTALLIHGFGGDLDNWLFNIDALAEYATVHALDLPGHGQSYKALHQPSISALADLVRAFMNSLEIGAAHLVGHSMGGAVALALASSSPKHVKSVTLIAPA